MDLRELFAELFPGHDFKWRRAGEGWVGLCPLHEDTHPSLSVFRGDGGLWFWKCHAGCGGGGPVSLVSRALGLPRDAARRWLRERGFSVGELGDSLIEQIYNWTKEQEIPGWVWDWLREKGVLHPSDALPVGWWPGQGPYEDMPPWPGLVFPYSPWPWGIKALKIRRVPKKEFVFLNPKGGWPGLFALPFAMRGLGEVGLVEGETDALALGSQFAERQGSWPNLVALGGGMGKAKALSAVKAAGYERVFFFPDNDEPGLRLAESLAREAAKEGILLSILWPSGYLPGEDPGSMVRRLGPGETLRRAYQGRKKPYEFVGMRIVELSGGGPEADIWAREEALRFAREASLGPLELHDFFAGLSEATGLPPELLRAELLSRGGIKLGKVEVLPFSELAKLSAEPPSGLSWPFEEFNRALGPMVPGSLYVVGGAPGSGKTTLLTQVADHLASREIPVLYLSLEEGPRSLVLRTLARELGIPMRELAGQNLSPMIERLREENPHIFSHKFVVMGARDLTPDFIEKEILFPLSWRLGRPPVLVVDYLQRLPYRGEPRSGVARNVMALKAMAERLPTVVLAASSVPKAGYGEMSLSSFKEAGEVEFTADCALGLSVSGGELRVRVLKNRFGRADPSGSLYFTLRFDGERARVG